MAWLQQLLKYLLVLSSFLVLLLNQLMERAGKQIHSNSIEWYINGIYKIMSTSACMNMNVKCVPH